MFLEIVRKMLRWKPEDRSSAEALLAEPWLKSAMDQELEEIG